MLTPKQQAQETAEKLVSKLRNVLTEDAQDKLIEFIKLELNLEQLIEDKMRLDWLDKNGDAQHIYEEGRPEITIPVINMKGHFNFDFIDITIRQAISTAMKEEE